MALEVEAILVIFLPCFLDEHFHLEGEQKVLEEEDLKLEQTLGSQAL